MNTRSKNKLYLCGKFINYCYYGIETLRGKENFEITKRGICRQLIKALAIVKKAAAKANIDAGNIEEKIGKAIMAACDEILNGRLHGQFVTDLIQGGAGTSMNMNANEVIANRANELLGGRKGEYKYVHPNDHVNFGQSTNDVIQTALHSKHQNRRIDPKVRPSFARPLRRKRFGLPVLSVA